MTFGAGPNFGVIGGSGVFASVSQLCHNGLSWSEICAVATPAKFGSSNTSYTLGL